MDPPLSRIRIYTKVVRIRNQCCGTGPILTGSGSGYRLQHRLPAPAPDNNIFVTQV